MSNFWNRIKINSKKPSVHELLLYPECNNINETIYHYCSLDAFMSIIESKCIHLSNNYTVNDYTENRIFDILYGRIAEKLLEKGVPEKSIERIYSDFILNNSQPVYIGSFSKKRDLLSQWRGYADNCNGVAIGFRFDKNQFCDTFPYKSNEIHYSIYNMMYIDNEVSIDSFVDAITCNNNIEGTGIVLLGIWNKVYKHIGFSEEQEVRIACVPTITPIINGYAVQTKELLSTSSLLKYKSKRNFIQSYVEFPFTSTNIVEIILGPKNTTGYDILSAYLEANDIRNAVISHSAITYR